MLRTMLAVVAFALPAFVGHSEARAAWGCGPKAITCRPRPCARWEPRFVRGCEEAACYEVYARCECHAYAPKAYAAPKAASSDIPQLQAEVGDLKARVESLDSEVSDLKKKVNQLERNKTAP